MNINGTRRREFNQHFPQHIAISEVGTPLLRLIQKPSIRTVRSFQHIPFITAKDAITMTSRERALVDLLNDPTCVAIMARDGVRARDVLNLMKSVKPLVLAERSHRRREEMPRFAA